MSSILKALKKIEEKAPQETGSPVWPSPVDVDGNRTANRRTVKAVAATGGLLFLLAGVAAVGWIGSRSAQTEKTATSPVPQRLPEPNVATNAVPQPHRPVPGRTVSPEKEPQQPETRVMAKQVPSAAKPEPRPVAPVTDVTQGRPLPPAPNKPGGPVEAAGSASAGPGVSRPSTPEVPAVPRPAASSQTASSVEAQSAKAQTAAVQTPSREQQPSPGSGTASGQKGQDDAVPPLKEGRLLLQAVSWSRQPEKRMAVISNEIVKEGGDVLGFDVVRIEENGVLVREGGKTWRLLFSK